MLFFLVKSSLKLRRLVHSGISPRKPYGFEFLMANGFMMIPTTNSIKCGKKLFTVGKKTQCVVSMWATKCTPFMMRKFQDKITQFIV
jgi:hypothetical protein